MRNDDWMNPETSGGTFTPKPHDDGTFYQIQRRRRQVTFGDPLLTWDVWAEFQDRGERDAELKRLRETTVWELRARTIIWFAGQARDPSDAMDL